MCKYLVQQWETWLPLTPIHSLVWSSSSMTPISCPHCWLLSSPSCLHFFPLPLVASVPHPPHKKEEGEEWPVVLKRHVSTNRTSDRSPQPSWNLVLVTQRCLGFSHGSFRCKCWLYFLSGASGYLLLACPETLPVIKAGAASEVWGRVLFRPKCNSRFSNEVTSMWLEENLSQVAYKTNTTCLTLTPTFVSQTSPGMYFDVVIRASSSMSLLCLLGGSRGSRRHFPPCRRSSVLLDHEDSPCWVRHGFPAWMLFSVTKPCDNL